MPNGFPPAAPAVTGTAITVDAWLRDPARVQRLLRDLSAERFIAEVIFAQGPQATGGAVLYDQVLANDLYMERDVEAIAPGADYPVLTSGVTAPKVATVTKWGGRVFITDEQKDRNRIDVFQRETIKLRNTIVRKVNRVAIAALTAAIDALGGSRDYTASNWSDPNVDVIADMVGARKVVNNADLGYEVDTLLINGDTEADLLARKDVRDALSDASKEAIVRDATLGRFLRMDIIVSNQVPDDTAFMLVRKRVGSISDETPLMSKVWREEKADSTWIQGGRRLVPYVTDPLAVVRLNGVRS